MTALDRSLYNDVSDRLVEGWGSAMTEFRNVVTERFTNLAEEVRDKPFRYFEDTETI